MFRKLTSFSKPSNILFKKIMPCDPEKQKLNSKITKFNCFIYCLFLFLKESLYLEILIKCSFFICCFLLLDSRTSQCCVCVCICFRGSLCDIATINITEQNPTRPFL